MSSEEHSQYLYHYTSMTNALSIVATGELWFSPIAKSNDVWEVKNRKIRSSESDEVESWSDYTFNSNSGPLTFSISLVSGIAYPEVGLIERQSPTPGFFIAPAWELYAARYQGACFVFDKEKFVQSSRIGNQAQWTTQRDFICYDDQKVAEPVEVNRFHNAASNAAESSNQTEADRQRELFDRWKEIWDNHHQDLFFVKSKDWEYEREYRVIRYPALLDIAVKVIRREKRAPAITIDTALKAIILFEETANSPFVRTIQRLMNGSVQLLAISHSTGAFKIAKVP